MTADGVDVSWQWAPVVTFSLFAWYVIYAVRWARVRENNPDDASRWRVVSFFFGIVTLFLALTSPIDPLGEQMFFWHMAQHIMLLDVAPLLLILGLNEELLRPVTAAIQRVERAAGPFASPLAAIVLYIGTLYVWHIPALYDAALESNAIHSFQHVMILAVGLMFWWYAVGPIRPRKPVTGMKVVGYMISTKLFTGVLASAIAFAPFGTLFTDYYADTPRLWGFDPEEDQRTAGALMMFEELFVMTSVFAWMFVRMLGDSDREDQLSESDDTP